MITGGCLCGAVRYEAEGEPMFSALCHCRDCQKATGTGHVAVVALPRAAVKLTGEIKSYAKLGDSGKTTTRHFCPVCGSLIFGEPEMMQGVINISVGTLDDPSTFKPQVAIYTRSRHDWDQVPGRVQEFETAPPLEAVGS